MSFPRYPKYKDSGVEWLGEVPQNWEVGPIKRLIRKVESGTSVNASDQPTEDGEIGVLKTSCVYTGTFDPDENKSVVKEEINRVSCPLKVGTLIVSRMNTPELIGAAGLVTQARANLYLPDRLWQISFSNADARFVHYWTLTSLYRAQVTAICAGASSSMKSLSQDQFGNFSLVMPQLLEQTNIAAFLDRETAKIDELVAKQRRLMDLLKEKRQAVIYHAVTKGLNANAPMKASGIKWPAQVPAHWEVLPLTRVVRQFVDYRGVTPEKLDEGSVPLITATQIKNGRIDHLLDPVFISEDEYKARMTRGFPERGDVLITTEAPLGETAQIDDEHVSPGQRIILMKPNLEKITKAYLFTHFRSQFGQKELWIRASGSTASGIRADRLRASAVLVPPLEEQVRIVRYIDDEVSHLPPIEEAAQKQIELLQERRIALISAAVTGQIDVRGLIGAVAA